MSAAQGATILVVDDEAPVRGLITRVLQASGADVIEAASPLAALEAVSRQGSDLDLVVSDVAMPQMTGFELWDRVRDRHADLPFLFLSGYVEEELAAAAAVHGRQFLSKPFSPGQLKAAVEAALGGGTDRPAPAD